jgi:5-methyltetrahydrofolate--homocysteine methyltransferase
MKSRGEKTAIGTPGMLGEAGTAGGRSIIMAPDRRTKRMAESILDLAKKRTVLLDGGLGSELIRRGFPMSGCPETWNVDRPEVVMEIHRNYFAAGSDAVLTNSFGGSRIKLAGHGEERRCYELNKAAAVLAGRAKPAGKYIGGSIGPTGKFLKPQGEYDEREFEESFAEQARGLADGGVNFLLIETQYDLREALSALRGARKAAGLPVYVTMTFKPVPRGFFTIMGDSVPKCLDALAAEGVPAVGANCTIGSEEMADLVRVMRAATDLPIIAQANAGQPAADAEGRVSYFQTPEEYVSTLPAIIENGASIVGGCCGTTPDHIRLMADRLKIS